MVFFLKGLAAFVSMALIDAAWVKYDRALDEGRSTVGANWAVLLYLLGAGSVMVYSSEPWVLPFGAAGAWLGTKWTVRDGTAIV